MQKEVKRLIPATTIDMGGIPIKQAIPTSKVDQVDPFLLLHHGTFRYRDDAPALHQGIGPHPHRGFSPVTFILEGDVHHRDSRGNNQIAEKGDVQWIHAGMGIIHSERPSQKLVENKGKQEIIQLWINSPADKKMQVPQYHYLPLASMPVFSSDDGKGKSKLVAGTYKEWTSPVPAQSKLLIIWAEISGGGKEIYTLVEDFNTMLYVAKGEVKVPGYGMVGKESLLVFEKEGEEIPVKAGSDTEFLILSGKPLDEKVVRQGPFVMNTETQILEALRDYQMGKMGFLVEE